ncbi:9977_t:CDS:2 [Gigaspora margarita]|uniref:9977_t:CDS:1 n=1 Tax=Gigaspora margarita TaxID=4874 RepID=A0ABN7UU96_GIGMA|nr:9977_t:CDS:2 [Gigaspora margarita]
MLNNRKQEKFVIIAGATTGIYSEFVIIAGATTGIYSEVLYIS